MERAYVGQLGLGPLFSEILEGPTLRGCSVLLASNQTSLGPRATGPEWVPSGFVIFYITASHKGRLNR